MKPSPLKRVVCHANTPICHANVTRILNSRDRTLPTKTQVKRESVTRSREYRENFRVLPSEEEEEIYRYRGSRDSVTHIETLGNTFSDRSRDSMLDQIISNFEIAKNQISKSNESIDSAIENEITSLDGSCSTCGGDEFWQPKRSDEWRCCRCTPPKSESLVAQKRGGLEIALGGSVDSGQRETVDAYWAQRQGPLIVWHPFRVCACGSDVSEELWTIHGADKICSGCGKQLFIDDFVGLESSRHSRLGNVK